MLDEGDEEKEAADVRNEKEDASVAVVLDDDDDDDRHDVPEGKFFPLLLLERRM